MKRLVLALAVAALLATPAAADLKPGAKAPDFTAKAYLAGKAHTFKLSAALKKGPVVMYFFPAAYTGGCNIETRMFSEAADQFAAKNATLIGITAGNTDRIEEYSKDTQYCAGKFALLADPDAKIALEYDTVLRPGRSGRTSYVLSPDGTVIHAYSEMKPQEHVSQTLGALTAWKASKK